MSDFRRRKELIDRMENKGDTSNERENEWERLKEGEKKVCIRRKQSVSE